MSVGTHAEPGRKAFAESFPQPIAERRDAWRVSVGCVERLDERTRNANGFCRGLGLVHDGIRGSWRKSTWPS
jgi:hypothetical protein